MKIRIPMITVAMVAASASFAFDFDHPVEGLTAGASILGQGGWSGTGTSARTVDATTKSPANSSTQSIKYAPNGATARMFKNFGATATSLDHTGVYLYNFDARSNGLSSTGASAFHWIRQQICGHAGDFANTALGSGLALLTPTRVPTMATFPVSVEGTSFDDGTGNFVGGFTIYSYTGLAMDSAKWYNFQYILNMDDHRVAGPTFSEIQTGGSNLITGVAAETWPMSFNADPADGHNIGNITKFECLRLGTDGAAFAAGSGNWDNFNFTKGTKIVGKMILDAPSQPLYVGSATNLTTVAELQFLQYTYEVSPATGLYDIQGIQLNADGTFVAAFFPGTFDIYYSGGSFLSKKAGNVTLGAVGTTTDLGDIQLLNGDIDGNDIINTDDYLLLSGAFDTVPGDAAYDDNIYVDIDQNEVVNTDDYLILSGNFDNTGDLTTDGR